MRGTEAPLRVDRKIVSNPTLPIIYIKIFYNSEVKEKIQENNHYAWPKDLHNIYESNMKW